MTRPEKVGMPMLTCPHRGCQHAIYEDREFTVTANRYGSERRRYVGHCGHTTYVPPPVTISEEKCASHPRQAMPCDACQRIAWTKTARKARAKAAKKRRAMAA